MSTAMMAMTTNSSMRVNAERRYRERDIRASEKWKRINVSSVIESDPTTAIAVANRH
jgi:hypothetical protein